MMLYGMIKVLNVLKQKLNRRMEIRRPYHWDLSSSCANLSQSPQTSSGRPERGRGAQAEGRQTSPCLHPGKSTTTTTKITYTHQCQSQSSSNESRPLLYILYTPGHIEIKVLRDLHACISSPNISEKTRLKVQQKWALSSVQKVHSNSLHQGYYKDIMRAIFMSCRLFLAGSTLLSSSHLENLIIYTSAPLDAVPMNRLQVWMKPDQSGAGEREMKSERQKADQKRAREGERFVPAVNEERENK